MPQASYQLFSWSPFFVVLQNIHVPGDFLIEGLLFSNGCSVSFVHRPDLIQEKTPTEIIAFAVRITVFKKV